MGIIKDDSGKVKLVMYFLGIRSRYFPSFHQVRNWVLVLGPSLDRNIFKSISLIIAVELDLTRADYTWT